MRDVVLFGAGKVGRMIATLLSESREYSVLVADTNEQSLGRLGSRERIERAIVDATDRAAVDKALDGRTHVVSALSFRFNQLLAEAALHHGVSYFDLSEDVETTRRVRRVAESARPGQTFVPQCGLAPGFVSILANHLATHFDRLDALHMRVGALPQYPSNALRYNLTWSTDGLINEYCNPCEAILDGKRTEVLPLEGLEHFWLDGVNYEAFNTSGGVGTLCDKFEGRLRELNYKTIRYPGHRDLMSFLINELCLGERRNLLKDVLEQTIPVTFQDMVVVFCNASGWRGDQLVQVSDSRIIHSRTLYGEAWSAIQISTAAALCAVLDLSFEKKLPDTGFVRADQIELDDFLSNRFGKYYGDAPKTGQGKS